MTTLYVGLTVMLVFVSIAMIALVLLQKGKGADAGAAFGAGASGTVFGARGSTNFLSRSTAVLATVFFLNCLALAYLGTQRATPESILDRVGVEADETGEAGDGLIPAPDDLADDVPVLDLGTETDEAGAIPVLPGEADDTPADQPEDQ